MSEKKSSIPSKSGTDMVTTPIISKHRNDVITRRDSSSSSSRPRNRKNTRSSPKVRKRKRRFEPSSEKLPTPPPDPRCFESSCDDTTRQPAKRKSIHISEDEPKSDDKSSSRLLGINVNSASARGFADAFAGTEEAFQQLDRLRSVLEELLELRHKNAKFFRRVRELERQRASRRLEESTRLLLGIVTLPPEEEDEAANFAESLLNAMLESSASSSSNQTVPASPNQEEPRYRPPLHRQRSRSIGDNRLPGINNNKRNSNYYNLSATKTGKRNSIIGTLGIIPPKISKWTKVKAAFKWERASIGTSNGLTNNSTLGNVVLEAMEQENAKYLKPTDGPPDTTTSTVTTLSGSSPRTGEHSGPPSPGTLSSSSSIDDVYNGGYKRTFNTRTSRRGSEEDPAQGSRSPESESSNPQNIATLNTRDAAGRRSEKSYKTPWGIVKDIIQSRRDNVRRPVRTSVRSDDGYSLSSHESSDMIPEIFTQDQTIKPRQMPTTISPDHLTLPSSSSSSSNKPSNPGKQSNDVVDLASRRLTPTLTITLPSSEELRSVSPESPATSSLQQQQQSRIHLDSNSTDEGQRSPADDVEIKGRPATNPGSPVITATNAPRLSGRLQRQDSKWNKVKRAFLSGASSVPPSPSRTSSFFDETDGGGSYSASAEELDNGGVSPTIQADIQRNYQLLHDKLSLEFHRKLTEWDKLKNGQTTNSNTIGNRSTTIRPATSPKDKDSANALLLGEEQLTPEFKKKLQEWKRIKKGGNVTSGSMSPEQPHVSRRRLTDWQIWRTTGNKSEGKNDSDSGKINLSEDFLKKMEEWKKIKSAKSDEEQSGTSRRDSTEFYQSVRNSNGQKRKLIDEKEFQPLDKVINMIEREQLRVEKHRERLLDNLSRLNELSHILGLAPEKREILVRTSTGFYRFEGISQEFTRKLYEWEKSQGIAPEFSTFRLLKPAYDVYANDNKLSHNKGSKNLKRSKSMSSVVENSLREETPIRQPSSLSLNDVSNLESEGKLRIDSKQTIGEEEMSEELGALDDYEPEAVIVDIEDVIEETASPMAKFQPQQTPVYCVTASETTSIAVPLGTVTASHEPSPVILIQAGDNHDDVRKYCQSNHRLEESLKMENNLENDASDVCNTVETDLQKTNDYSNDDHRKRIFEPNEIKICETIIEEEASSSQKGEESDTNDDTSSVKTENDVESLKEVEVQNSISVCIPILQNEVNQESEISINCKNSSKEDIPEHLEKSSDKPSNDVLENNCVSLSLENKLEEVVKTTEESDQTTTNDPVIETHEENNADENQVFITVNSNIRQKKVLKTRRLTDTQVGYQWQQPTETIKEVSPEPTDSLTVSTYSETPKVERIIINESTLNKIVVPTASNEQLSTIGISDDSNTYRSNDVTNDEEPHCRRLNIKTESKNVFVKTKRMIFSPFSRRNSKDKNALIKDESNITEPPVKEPIDSSPSPIKSKINLATKTTPKLPDVQRSKSSSDCIIQNLQRPPIPQSPILSRKEYRRLSPKETAPSIRMMIQRYNQKLQEDASSPASSGSGSPIWRSPISERRVRTQMERYQEEVQRAISGSPRSRIDAAGNGDRSRILEKSASASVIQSTNTTPNSATFRYPRGGGEILKSTSADFLRNSKGNEIKRMDNDDDCSESDRTRIKIDCDDVSLAKRKNSLKNPEIITNIKQSLVQEYKTLQIKTDDTEDDNRADGLMEKNYFDGLDKDICCGGVKRDDELRKQPEKFSPDLMHKLNALSSGTNQKNKRFYGNFRGIDNQVVASENSTPLRIRAQRLKKAKDDFFSRGPSCHSHDPSIESCRHNQSAMMVDPSNKIDFIKSASAGMINVDTRMQERVSTSDTLPRVEKACTEITGTFSKLASKFRRTKLKKGKEKEGKMSTVSMLCRQSLFVDIQPDGLSKSCPTSPSPHRDEDEVARFQSKSK